MSLETSDGAGGGRLLIVDDEPDMTSGLKSYLSRLGHKVATAGSAEQALELLRDGGIDLVLTDLMLPGQSGLELLAEVKRIDGNIGVVLFTGYATVETAVEAIKRGAFDYISKPFTPKQLEAVVARALRHKGLADENRNLRGQIKERFSFQSLLGFSAPMKQIEAILSRVSSTEASVLIYGESGTGKELVARAVHANSRRQSKPFIPLDCAALPLNLIESELFGYERGAFTGANTSRAGLLEAAHGGTFFMDELGELDLAMQVKLLRVLQERQFRRVGGSKQISVDVRIVAATNRDLLEEVRAGRFREDLYHRLNVVQIRLPPLRERHGDIPILVNHFIHVHAPRMNRSDVELSADAMSALESYAWPGNVRELQNAIEYALSISEGNRIELCDLPQTILSTLPSSPCRPSTAAPQGEDRLQVGIEGSSSEVAGSRPMVHHELPYKQAKRKWLETFEREYFAELLKRQSYNISHAARAAQIDRKSIQRILKKNNLDVGILIEDE